MGRHTKPAGRNGVHITESTISAGNELLSSIPVYTYSNVEFLCAKDADQAPMTVVMGNGAFKSRGTVGRFVRAYVREAAEDGRMVKAVTYDEPGSARRYTAAERVRRFARVLLHVAQEGGGSQLHMIGHSIAATDALNIAYALQPDGSGVDGLVKSVTLLTPVGYAVGGQPHGLAETIGRAQREAMRVRQTITGLGSMAVVGSLLSSMATRFVGSPLNVIDMTQRAFQADNVDRFSKIYNEARFGINALLAEHDAFYPTELTRQTLIAAGLPSTHIGILEGATHLSAVTNDAHGAAAYRFMSGQ